MRFVTDDSLENIMLCISIFIEMSAAKFISYQAETVCGPDPPILFKSRKTLAANIVY